MGCMLENTFYSYLDLRQLRNKQKCPSIWRSVCCIPKWLAPNRIRIGFVSFSTRIPFQSSHAPYPTWCCLPDDCSLRPMAAIHFHRVAMWPRSLRSMRRTQRDPGDDVAQRCRVNRLPGYAKIDISHGYTYVVRLGRWLCLMHSINAAQNIMHAIASVLFAPSVAHRSQRVPFD